LKYFLSFRNFDQLALVLKTEFALKFFKPGGAAAPLPYVLAYTKIIGGGQFLSKVTIGGD